MSSGLKPSPETILSILACYSCDDDRQLIRDDHENIPIPPYVGSAYRGVLLAARNPGIGGRSGQTESGAAHRAALRAFRDGEATLEDVRAAQLAFWPGVRLWQNYVPLDEWDLTPREVAFCNVVACRTVNNKLPSVRMRQMCSSTHFAQLLDDLEPRIVVFLGLGAASAGQIEVERRCIPSVTVNRDRALSRTKRTDQRAHVARLVRQSVDAALHR